MKEYDHKKIETKWQKYWERKKLNVAKDLDSNPRKSASSRRQSASLRKFYGLIEFPFLSGEGLHVGHIRSYTALDIVSRKRRAEGFNVLYPIGYDAFGLPIENFAIKTGKPPALIVKNTVRVFRRQLKSLGFSFDWSREISTSDPAYYKWTQWIFLKFFEKGLAYKKKMAINWCPKDKIGLANEEVVTRSTSSGQVGCCERCGTPVEKRDKEQWMLAITKYADRLDKDLDGRKILIGTRNPAKVKMIKACLAGVSGIELVMLEDIPVVDDSDLREGDDFLENARRKSEFYFKKTGIPTIATDHILWIEKWTENKGFMVHVRKHANAESPRASDEEVILFFKNFLKTVGGQSRANFHYGISFTDEAGTIAVDEVPQDYILQGEQAKSYWPGYPTEALLKDASTGMFKSEQTDSVRYAKVIGVLKEKFVPRMRRGTVDYLEKIKIQQKNWIGRSEGAEIKFSIFNFPACQRLALSGRQFSKKEKAGEVEIFTTRPDTIFGATYLVLAPEHEFVSKLMQNQELRIKNHDELVRYIVLSKKKNEIERTADKNEKTGVKLEGIVAINPANQEEIPVFVADYVLASYGTGAIMAVPAHDQRDFDFAQKFGLPIKVVVRERPETYLLFVTRGIVSDWKVKLDGYKWKMREDWGLEVYVSDEETKKILLIAQSLLKDGPYYASTHGNTRFIIYKNKIFDIYTAGENEKAKSHGRSLQIPENELDWSEAVISNGLLCNSDKFDGLDSEKSKKKITEFVGGKMITTYKLRDWIFSRQRYWGEPIPLVFCEACKIQAEITNHQSPNSKQITNHKFSNGELTNPGWFAVSEKDLPIKLPNVKNYQPTDTGESPLANISKWVNVKCPVCKGPARRETDTMPNWAGSSWYYLRYIDPKNTKEFASRKKLEFWSGISKNIQTKNYRLPTGLVDWYNGGMEHTTLHLLYSRFWHKFLFDLGLVPTSEPYQKRTSHGLILAEGGVKMSKSKGNVVNPDDIIKTFGADTLRLYEMFMGPFDQHIVWNTESMVGPRRFLEKVWRLFEKTELSIFNFQFSNKSQAPNHKLETLTHKTIKKVSEDIEAMRFNTAVSSMMVLVNEFEKVSAVSKNHYEILLRLLAPFAPHITEELWSLLKHPKSIHLEPWPTYDAELANAGGKTLVIQVNGKVRANIEIEGELTEALAKEKALALPEIKKWIEGKTIRKVIYVPGRLINIVI